MPWLLPVLAWLVLGTAIAAALLLVNGAAFSAWMSAGPPDPYPQGWALRSLKQLAWAASTALGGYAAFRAIREIPALRRTTLALAVAAVALTIPPCAYEYLQVDRCLDTGGRWNTSGMQCEHQALAR
ncbi:hypothetical protein [Roseateles sp.]|uniref:hypothetical protein n=1 Tax=Roseateles sp. TaxID=1971397 RepID=UPI0025DEAD3A|nr:hypothetical protein [Roseateles sp.]MBV8033550.1 hypothetical protein [Roseateles sp.]